MSHHSKVIVFMFALAMIEYLLLYTRNAYKYLIDMFTRLRLPRALFSLSRHKIDNIPMLDTFMAQQPV